MFDVTIAGGGAGGCAAAIGLARRGFSVAILDRARPVVDCVGETLAPSIRPLLADLGVWERFSADGHEACHGMHSAWGTTGLHSNDFVFNPYGQGWRIQRRRFDAMLARAAGEAGAVFYNGAALVNIEEAGAGWKVSARGGDGRFELTTRFLVDATGRSASVARRMGTRRINLDRTVAVARTYEMPPGEPDPDSFTLVETSTDGWWYSALLPTGQLAVLYFTDPVSRHLLEPPPHTRARIGQSRGVAHPKLLCASSSILERAAGRAWLALGDAESTWDPLSSQGIAKAIKSSAMAVATIAGSLAGDANATSEYAAQARDTFARYLEVRRHYYGREKRWPESSFWQTRCAGMAKFDGADSAAR